MIIIIASVRQNKVVVGRIGNERLQKGLTVTESEE
jgi:hypothetical protein